MGAYPHLFEVPGMSPYLMVEDEHYFYVVNNVITLKVIFANFSQITILSILKVVLSNFWLS